MVSFIIKFISDFVTSRSVVAAQTTVKNIVKSVTGDKKNKRDDNGSKGTTRSRFNTAFAKAKKEGLDIFEFEGKKYTTKTK